MMTQLLERETTSDDCAPQDSERNPLESPLRNDLLFGAKAIAHELGISERQAFYILEHGYVPATKAGRV